MQTNNDSVKSVYLYRSTASVPTAYIEQLLPGLLDTVLDLVEGDGNANAIAFAEVRDKTCVNIRDIVF